MSDHPTIVGRSVLALREGLENSVAFLDAFACAVRVIYPRLPTGMGRPAILEDGTVWTIDDPSDLRVHAVNPLTVLREEGCKVLIRRLWAPLLRYVSVARGTVVVYRRIKRDRAGEAPAESCFKLARAHKPKDGACGDSMPAGVASKHEKLKEEK